MSNESEKTVVWLLTYHRDYEGIYKEIDVYTDKRVAYAAFLNLVEHGRGSYNYCEREDNGALMVRYADREAEWHLDPVAVSEVPELPSGTDPFAAIDALLREISEGGELSHPMRREKAC